MDTLRERMEGYLRDKVKFIGDGETTYLGCPTEHITAILALVEKDRAAVVKFGCERIAAIGAHAEKAEAREAALVEEVQRAYRMATGEDQVDDGEDAEDALRYIAAILKPFAGRAGGKEEKQ